MNCTGYPNFYDELEGIAYFECPYDHKCDGCEFDCGDDDI